MVFTPQQVTEPQNTKCFKKQKQREASLLRESKRIFEGRRSMMRDSPQSEPPTMAVQAPVVLVPETRAWPSQLSHV